VFVCLFGARDCDNGVFLEVDALLRGSAGCWSKGKLQAGRDEE
jgi:hypothetical protein